MNMRKFIYSFRIAKNGPWEIISNKNEKFLFGWHLGLVKKGGKSGILIIFGPIYFIFGWK